MKQLAVSAFAAMAAGLVALSASAKEWGFSVPEAPFKEGGYGAKGGKPAVAYGIDWMKENAFRIATHDEKANALMNPGFESGLRYWRVERGREWRDLLVTDAHSGCYAFKPNCEFSSVGTVLKPDTTYVISAYVKSLNGLSVQISVGLADPTPGFHKSGEGTVLNLAKAQDRKWHRVHAQFTTAACIHEIRLMFMSRSFGNFLIDDIQVQEGKALIGKSEGPALDMMEDGDPLEEKVTLDDANDLKPYSGSPVGFQLVTGSDDPIICDAAKPLDLKLALRAPKGSSGKVVVKCEDFLGRRLPPRTFDWSFPKSDRKGDAGRYDEKLLDLGTGDDYPLGVLRFEVTATPRGGKPFCDFLRLNRFPFSDGTAKLHDMVLASGGGFFCALSNNVPDVYYDRFVRFGIGGFVYSAAFQPDVVKRIEAHGLTDWWGCLINNHGDFFHPDFYIDDMPFKYEGEDLMRVDNCPQEVLDRVTERAARVVSKRPYVKLWCLKSEPQSVVTNALRRVSYAKLAVALWKGVKKGNPNAQYCPYGCWNMHEYGRGDILDFMRVYKDICPEAAADMQYMECHTYRGYPENPDCDQDVTDFLRDFDKLGYGHTKLKLGEGAYYFPMRRPSHHLDAGVKYKDAYSRYVMPSYDIGWGERIGAAQTTREWIMYYSHADRIAGFCSWSPDWYDNETPLGWMVAVATAAKKLGDSTFVRRIRFSQDSRAYVFRDGHGHAVAAVWRGDMEMDKGERDGVEATIDASGFALEAQDMFGNPCATGKKDLKLALSGFPLYLQCDEKDLDKLVAALSEARVAADDGIFPLVSDVHLRSETEAELVVMNPLSRTIMAEMTLGGKAERVTFAGDSERRFAVTLTNRVSRTDFAEVVVPVRFRIGGVDFDKTFKTLAMAVAYAPGDKPDWSKVPVWKVGNYRAWAESGPDNAKTFTANAQLAWNEDHFFMRYETRDSIFFHEDPEVPWGMSDMIWMFFDPFANGRANLARGFRGHDMDDFRYDLYALSENEGAVMRRLAADIQFTGGAEAGLAPNVVERGVPCAFSRKGRVNAWEVDFPRRYLLPLKLEAGNSPGFAVRIYNRDLETVPPRKSRGNVPGWNSNEDNHPEIYPQIIFAR